MELAIFDYFIMGNILYACFLTLFVEGG